MTSLPPTGNWGPGSCRENDRSWKEQHLKNGEFLDGLLTKVTSQRGTETKGLEVGLQLPTLSPLLSHFLQVLRRQQLVGSQSPPKAWEGGQKAEFGKPRILAKAEEHGLCP